MGKEFSEALFNKCMQELDTLGKDPSKLEESTRKRLELLYSKLCKPLAISEHSKWRVTWRVEKWLDTMRKKLGYPPDDVLCESQNIILDVGANEILKLIADTGGTPYSAANTYIYVGTDTTAENPNQNGVIASGINRAFAAMDTGYPIVQNRQIIYRASFGDTTANFAWHEAAIVNGIGANSVAMNRKVATLGTKVTGTWSLEITVSLTN